MVETSFKEKMKHYNIMIKNLSGKGTEQFKPVSKLQLIKFAIIALLILSVAIAVFFAAFIIGLLLVLPLIILGILWFIYMSWRGKIRIQRSP